MDYRFNLLSELDSLSENGTIIISRPSVDLTWKGGKGRMRGRGKVRDEEESARVREERRKGFVNESSRKNMRL